MICPAISISVDRGRAIAVARRQRYATFLGATVADQERNIIRLAVQRGQLTGGQRFVDAIEQKLKRRIELCGAGRRR